MQNDVKILRRLADEYAVFARSERNKEKIELHRSMNDLNQKRPIVLIDEIPWHEMHIGDELKLQCSNPYFREVEWFLRSTLYKFRHMPADMAVTDYIPVAKIIESTGIGVEVDEKTIQSESGEGVQSHQYHNQFEDHNIEKLHNPIISYNKEETVRRYNMLGEAIGDIIPIKITGEATGYGLGCKTWDIIPTLIGVDHLLMGLIDRPDFMHELAKKLTDIFLSIVHQYDALNLFDTESLYVHCTAATTSDMPMSEGDYEHSNTRKLWGRGLAQILATVSPDMHDEFDITYMIKAMEPFGLIYYGCCEPLHNKIHILEKIPRLRKISITPWADINVAADIIGKRYVVSAKPNPSNLSSGILDNDVIRRELSSILDACKRNDCAVELVLKDISTVGGRPQNLFEWEKIAMELVNAY